DTLRVEDARVAPTEAAVEGFGVGDGVLDVDADDLHLRLRAGEGCEGARFRVAAGTPGGPHVEHDRLARVRGETDRTAGERVGAAELERCGGRAAACGRAARASRAAAAREGERRARRCGGDEYHDADRDRERAAAQLPWPLRV